MALDGEKLLTLNEARAYLLDVRGLTRTYEALRRWVQVGRRGVRLEALEVGGRWHTSREAIERFFEATTRRPVETTTRRPVTAAQRKGYEEGMRRLREMGLKV